MGDSPQPTDEPRPTEAQGPPPRSLALFLIAVGVPSFFVGVISTLVLWAATRTKPVAAAPAAASSEPAAATAPASAAASSFVRVGKPEAANPEAEARRALAKFRDGIGACVREVIQVLPGTSPAVPGTFKLMKDGVYTSTPADFRTPVYSCAKYSETAPQPFQIQWQRGTTQTEGMGVAWLDDNRDGEPDRAFGFTAKLVKKKEVTFGEIVPLSPVPKVQQARQ